jgi:hypothetical protein
VVNGGCNASGGQPDGGAPAPDSGTSAEPPADRPIGPAADGGVPATTDAGTGSQPPTKSDDSGCQMSTGAGATPAALALAVLALAALRLRSLRRRRSSEPA